MCEEDTKCPRVFSFSWICELLVFVSAGGFLELGPAVTAVTDTVSLLPLLFRKTAVLGEPWFAP